MTVLWSLFVENVFVDLLQSTLVSTNYIVPIFLVLIRPIVVPMQEYLSHCLPTALGTMRALWPR